jgi:hypothetical protein
MKTWVWGGDVPDTGCTLLRSVSMDAGDGGQGVLR